MKENFILLFPTIFVAKFDDLSPPFNNNLLLFFHFQIKQYNNV